MSEDARNAVIGIILEKYDKLLRKVAYGIIRDNDEVDDIIQEVMLRLIQSHFDKVDLESDRFKRYICAAVKNTAINAYNKKHRHGEEPADPFVLAELAMDKVDTRAFDDEYGFGPELQLLIGQLDNIDKEIIRLKYGCGYGAREIALALDMKEDNVRKRSQRALKKMQLILLEKEVDRDDR